MVYYNLGGGNSPKGWLTWIISLVVFVALAFLLLPVLGVVVLVFMGLGAVLFLAASVWRFFAAKKIERAFRQAEASAEAERRRREADATPAAAGSGPLEVRDAVVVSEVERRTRREAERGAGQR